VVVAVGVILAGWVPTLPAGAAPHLPAQTVDQLVSRLEEPAAPGLVGTLTWRAELGLPDLGGSGGESAFSLSSLASGTTTAGVWYGPSGERLAVLGAGTETDVYSGTGGVWLYDSATDTATRLDRRGTGPTHLPLVGPQLVVAALLGAIPADTRLWEGTAEYVAGRPAYLLELAPQPGTAAADDSTVGRITVAVDATTGIALAVSVYAKRASAPALALAFTSVRYVDPGARQFRFTPAPGTSVKEAAAKGRQGGAGLLAVLAGAGAFVGRGWAPVVVLRGRAGQALAGTLDAATTGVAGPSRGDRLLETSLVNALLLPDGTVVLGLATPATLFRAVGS
jgi:outer membrane lipoprotein-sorting protein